MAAFCSFQNRFYGVAVPHFTHQDHVWRLPQGRSQSQRGAWSIAVQLALVNCGLLVSVQEFNRIFDSNDMADLLLVDPVEKRGQSRRLPRTARPGDQYDAFA